MSTQQQASTPRKKINSQQAWIQHLNEMQQAAGPGQPISFDPSSLRRECFKDIEAYRKRPLLIYYTKFINGVQPGIPNALDLTDIDGFTDLINSIPPDQKAVDILIHSPGGRPDATERIVYMLRKRFEEVHFLVSHSAYSAATMLALSGNSITLHSSATLGPIDPQINGIPARSIKKGFAKVKDAIKPETLPAYLPLIEKYTLELLEMCDDSEKLSQELVTEWLSKYMLPREVFEGQIKKAVEFFSDYENHLLHARPLVLDKLRDLKLNIEYASPELNELLWEAYILLENFLQMSPFVKLFENLHGVSWGRQFNQVMIPNLQKPQPPARQEMTS